jgi:hypothetical protein
MKLFRSYYYLVSILAVRKSAFDTSGNVLVGRPYGGIAILFRKELPARVIAVEMGDCCLWSFNMTQI